MENKKKENIKNKCKHINCKNKIVLIEMDNTLCVGCTFASKKDYTITTIHFIYPLYSADNCYSCCKK